MCGIVGSLGNNKASNKSILEMAKTIDYRGPDDFGVWSDNKYNIYLGHRRLSILDLTNNGHQPMISKSGRYIIVFNGEIYNHIAIRNNYFNDFDWNGSSDTETLLAAFEKWGIENSLKFLVGMFSFAVWDRHEESLNLVRDRFGEKPLFYYNGKEGVVFASELKAINFLLNKTLEINDESLAIFLCLSYVPCPLSIYKDVFKLEPGHLIKFSKSGDSVSKPYWSLEEKYFSAKENIFNGNDTEAINILESLLKNTLKNQTISDVPLGAFLSGGIDSSLVTSLLQSESSVPIKTFTIGFDSKDFDESDYAKKVSSYLKTDHTEFFVSSKDALEIIPCLQKIYDEPFADSSQIPTFFVSKLAKEKVTVALSGDGADELFAGYNRYIFTEKIWRTLNRVPLRMRKSCSKFLSKIPNPLIEAILNTSNNFLPIKSQFSYPMSKYTKMMDILKSGSEMETYYRLISYWSFSPPITKDIKFDFYKYLKKSFANSTKYSFLDEMMLNDLKYYLSDDILQKVDRASMASSLETRTPFLDHQLAEFSFSLPLNMKLRNGESKWILRQLLKKYLPVNLFERRKMGFSVPIDSWLIGPLRDWAEDLLSNANLLKYKMLDSQVIRQAWSDHLRGKSNQQYPLWNVLMFLSWHQNL